MTTQYDGLDAPSLLRLVGEKYVRLERERDNLKKEVEMLQHRVHNLMVVSRGVFPDLRVVKDDSTPENIVVGMSDRAAVVMRKRKDNSLVVLGEVRW